MSREDTVCVKFIIFSLFLLVLWFNPELAIISYAEDITVSESDEEGTYYYTYKSGTFTSNVKMSDTVPVAYIEWDENLSISLMKDGTQVSYSSGDILFAGGNYVAFVYDKKSGEYATFEFTIDNDLTSSAAVYEGTEYTNNDWDLSSSGLEGLNEIDIMSDLAGLEAQLGEFDENKVGRLKLSYSFDRENSMLVYSGANKELFIANVPNNSYVNSSRGAVVRATGDSMIYAFKDGELILQSGDKIFNEPGFYDIVAYVMAPDKKNLSEDEWVEGAYVYEAHFTFTIIPDEFNNISVITRPDGFVFGEVSYNGIPIEVPDGDYLFLDKDGEYYVEYEAQGDGLIYSFLFTRDTKAPIITFNNEIKRNVIRDNLSFSVNDKEAQVQVYLNNELVAFKEGMVSTDVGWYRLVATDKAGNSRIYTVYLDTSHRFFSNGMLISIAILLVAFVVYVISVRRGEYAVNDKPDKDE